MSEMYLVVKVIRCGDLLSNWKKIVSKSGKGKAPRLKSESQVSSTNLMKEVKKKHKTAGTDIMDDDDDVQTVKNIYKIIIIVFFYVDAFLKRTQETERMRKSETKKLRLSISFSNIEQLSFLEYIYIFSPPWEI